MAEDSPANGVSTKESLAKALLAGGIGAGPVVLAPIALGEGPLAGPAYDRGPVEKTIGESLKHL